MSKSVFPQVSPPKEIRERLCSARRACAWNPCCCQIFSICHSICPNCYLLPNFRILGFSLDLAVNHCTEELPAGQSCLPRCLFMLSAWGPM